MIALLESAPLCHPYTYSGLSLHVHSIKLPKVPCSQNSHSFVAKNKKILGKLARQNPDTELDVLQVRAVMLAATGQHVGKTWVSQQPLHATLRLDKTRIAYHNLSMFRTVSLGVFRGLVKRWGVGRVAYCKPLGQRYLEIELENKRVIKVRWRLSDTVTLRWPTRSKMAENLGPHLHVTRMHELFAFIGKKTPRGILLLINLKK